MKALITGANKGIGFAIAKILGKLGIEILVGARSENRGQEAVKKLSETIIGDEKHPYEQAKKLFVWLRTNYPWASAREYSTIDHISDYVIANKHGDCGQLSLLFITLCRYNGIPARWQSGFMLYPNGKNLHDWAEIYFEGIGWIPVDSSFGLQAWGQK